MPFGRSWALQQSNRTVRWGRESRRQHCELAGGPSGAAGPASVSARYGARERGPRRHPRVRGAGGALHEDHQAQHRRGQVCHQCQADRQGAPWLDAPAAALAGRALRDKVAPTDIEEGMRVGCAPPARAAAVHGTMYAWLPLRSDWPWARERTACPERRAAAAAAASSLYSGRSHLPEA